MLTPATPDNEAERLAVLHSLDLLDTAPEERFDRYTRLAKRLFGVPIVLVSLVDADRQWFKSRQGLEAKETGRDISFCGHAIVHDRLLMVVDALNDPRFADNPLVTQAPHIRFYAGAPLRSREGYPLGTLCLIDQVPRQLDEEQLKDLRDLADCVEDEINRARLREEKRCLQVLTAITSLEETDVSERLRQALQLGCALLNLEIGIISRIEQQEYRVFAHHAPGAALHDGQRFELGNTYCDLTYRANDVLSLGHFGESKHRGHPCYRAMGLESYIGVRLDMGNGRPFGTLNFSAPAPRPKDRFSSAEIEFVRLLGRWVAGQLLQRETDLALKRSERRFRLFAEAAPVGIFETDADGNCLFVNRFWCALSGLSPQQAAGQGWTQALHPEDRDKVFAEWSSSVRESRPFSLDYRFLDRAGGVHWVSGQAIALNDTDGSVNGFLGTITDITARKRIEQDLLHAYGLLEKSSEAARIGTWEVEIEGMQVSLSRVTKIIHEVPPDWAGSAEEAMGFYPEGPVRERMTSVFRAAVIDDQPFDEEFSMISARDNQRWIRAIGLPVRDAGRCIRVYGLFQDITERKQLEAVKSEFVSTVSHELRTPLTSINGSLALLESSGPSLDEPQVRGLLSIARKNGERLARLIDDLLDMEKLHAGKMRLDFCHESLPKQIEQAVQSNQAYAATHQCRISWQPPGEEVWVRIDASRLQQVLSNLLSNAAKFSPEGGTVSIEMNAGPERVRVQVRDQGPGVAAAFRERIFQKFSQADGSDRRAKGGTGLGLAISRELIERMDGEIGFESIEGEGATFFFELPRVYQDAASGAAAERD